MTLHEQISQAATDAMKARDNTRRDTLRGILSAFTNELVSQGKTPQDTISDDDAITVIKRLVKQRKDSIEQYENAGRDELAEGEKQELAILEEFLPEMMSVDEIKQVAQRKKEELGIDDASQSGKLIGAVMQEVKGKADGGDVKQAVESLF